MGRGKESEKQQQTDDTAELLPWAGCWVSGSTYRSAALRHPGKSHWICEHKSTPSPFIVFSSVSTRFPPILTLGTVSASPAGFSKCYLFVSLVGLNSFFIILLLSCQYNMGRGLGS